MEIWLSALNSLVQGFAHLNWQDLIMLVLGSVLLYLGIARNIEPFLLIPIGFGVILGNLPLAGLASNYSADGTPGIMKIIYDGGILTELFPCLLFVGLGAMIDFGPMLDQMRKEEEGHLRLLQRVLDRV